MAGEVLLEGPLAGKRPVAAMPMRADAVVSLRPRRRYVSRGGDKLAGALDAFGIDPTGVTAVDVGASTGGFTDCLLQRGAATVYAVDVGYGQLDTRLRADPRVVSMERVNAREGFSLPSAAGLAVVDVSFISLRLVLPAVFDALGPEGPVVALLKPQFEARRDEVGKGGVVRDPQLHARIVGRFVAWAVSYGVRVRDVVRSSLEGDAGNREFFLLLEPPSVSKSTGP